MTQLKLRSLIEGVENITSTQTAGNEPAKEWTAAEKKAALEKISEYGKYGKFLYREYGLMELAHNLSEIVKSAEELAIHETNRAAIDTIIQQKAVPALVQFIRSYGDKRGGWMATTGPANTRRLPR